MAMTMTQKILADHAGMESVTAGQLIEAKLDVVLANDITVPMALPIFRQMADKVFDKDKVVLVPDHFTPNKDIKSAENSKAILDFSNEQGLTYHMEQGKCGVEHAILPEMGIVVAGMGLWGLFQLELEQLILLQEWQRENYGLKYLKQLNLF